MFKKRLTWILVACAGLAALVAGSAASAEIVRLGNIELEVDGSFKPTKLPKNKLAPITLKVSTDIRTLDGTQPPVLNSCCWSSTRTAPSTRRACRPARRRSSRTR